MFRSIISLLNRRGAALGMAGVALTLAACSDAATAPAVREVGAPNSALVGTVPGPGLVTFATVHVADVYGKPISDKFLAVTFTSLPSRDSVVVVDNSDIDLDKTDGVLKAAIKPGTSYEVCFKDAYFYMNDDRDHAKYPKCHTLTTGSLNIDMGVLFGRRFPKIEWRSRDTFGNLIIPGGTVAVTFSWGTRVIADRDLNYGGVLDGIVKYESRQPPQLVKWCEYAPPPKYKLISAKCGEIQTQFETTHIVTWVHEQLLF